MQEIQQLQSKFDTCKYRSVEEQSRIIKRCSCQGGNYEIKGFYCEKKDLFKLSPEICQLCDFYETK